MKNRIFLPTIIAALGISGGLAFAAGTASDSAVNYVGNWGTSAANLGSGFGAWSFNDDNNNSTGPYAGTYMDQTSYGNSDGVLSSGYAWGTYANSGGGTGYFDMTRAFTPGTSGSANLFDQTFSIGMGSSGIGGSGSSLGLNIGTAFSVAYAGGGVDNMVLSVDGGAATAIPVDYANLNGGLLISLTVSGALNSLSENYTLAFSPFAGGSAIYSTSGTFDSLDFNTSGFTASDNNTSNDGFFNNPSITAEGTAVPEPTTIGLLGMGLAGLIWRRRK